MAIEKSMIPTTVDEVLKLLADYGKDGQILAGGTDLTIELRHGKNRGNVLIDITHVKELRFIEVGQEEIILGAATTFTDVVENEALKKNYPGLWSACKSVGSPQIRNMGTIGGNICNGSPAADSAPPLLALDAQLVIKSQQGERVVPLKDFYIDKGKVDLRHEEMVCAIKFKAKNSQEAIVFEKLGLRKALAISRLSCGIWVQLQDHRYIKDIRVATGSLGKYPQREMWMEQLLKNKEVCEDLYENAAEELYQYVAQRLQGRSSAEFKSTAIKGLFRRTLKAAVEEANNHD